MHPLATAFLILATTAPATHPVAKRTPTTKPATAWQVVWFDEFEQPGGAIDPERWQFERGMIRNREAQLYTDRSENVRVEDGCLIIEARKEHVPVPNKRGKFAEYTSGSVETFSKAGLKYARVEVRAKCPRGWGMWPAVWMMGENITEVGWPTCGEIDIMENVGFEPDRIHAAIHVKGEEGEKRELSETASAQVGRLAKEFHVYAMEWDAKQVRVWVDDRPYFTYDRFDARGEEKPWPFDQRLYLKLNLAIGGTWGGRHGIDDAAFPQKLAIDYVRVFKRAEAAAAR